MQAPPEDLFHADTNGFPDTDPAQTAALKKQAAELEKQRKAQEQRDRKLMEEERKRAERMQAMPDAKQKVEIKQADSKRELKLHKIRLYFRYFGDRLQVKEPKTLPKDPQAVDDLLASIEVELQSSGGIEQAASGYQGLLGGIEQVTQVFNPLGLQLSGPVASLGLTVAQNRDKWNDLVTEFAIAHAEWFMMGPGKRLILFTVQMVLAVDQANKAAGAVRRQAPPSEELQKEAEDL